MAMKELKKLVLIGAGRIAKVHTRSVLSLESVRIAAVVDPLREAGESVASIAGGVWYPTLEEAIESESFAGAIIAAPTPLHAELIERCVGLGLPVFCEKPVDLSLPRVDQCLERTKDAGVPVLLAFHRASIPLEGRYMRLSARVPWGVLNTFSKSAEIQGCLRRVSWRIPAVSSETC
jgi:myo-inositol 2-dehydrogenase / D-chiro-inositol 1-dehydrogenase